MLIVKRKDRINLFLQLDLSEKVKFNFISATHVISLDTPGSSDFVLMPSFCNNLLNLSFTRGVKVPLQSVMVRAGLTQTCDCTLQGDRIEPRWSGGTSPAHPHPPIPPKLSTSDLAHVHLWWHECAIWSVVVFFLLGIAPASLERLHRIRF